MKAFITTLIFIGLLLNCLPLQAEQRFPVWFFEGAEVLSPAPADCLAAAQDPSLNWKTQQLRKLEHGKTHCLKLDIELEAGERPVNPSLLFSALASSEIYWDGELILKNGQVGDSRSEEIPGQLFVHKALSKQQLSPGQHQLVMRLSNHHIAEELNGNIYLLAIGELDDFIDSLISNTLPAFIFIGALVPFALVFLLMFIMYQRDYRYLLFSLLCSFSSALLYVEKLKETGGYSYDFHLPRLHLVMLFTYSVCLLLPSFYLVSYRFKHLWRWVGAIALLLFVAFYIDPRYDAKSLLMFAASLGSSLVIQIIALRRKQMGARVSFTALLVSSAMLILMPFHFIEQWFGAVLSFIILTNLYYLIRQFADERQKALTSERLQNELLRRNLQPHYLMNSLTLIMEWVEQKPKAAVEFIESLAGEFRLLNTMSKEKRVSLADEVSLCENHLAIMGSRKQASYRLTVDSEADIRTLMLPPAIIHTLLENAFTHNRINDGTEFKLIVKKQAGKISIAFTTPMDDRHHEGTGTGDAYIRSRLEESYSGEWQIHSDTSDGQWTTHIEFPETA